MITYIAFLRGINVSGQKLIKMEHLRKLFTDWGFKNVRTYIQSGNVVFETTEKNEQKLIKYIEENIEQSFDYEVPTMIRTLSQLQEIVKDAPFKMVETNKEISHYIMLLHDELNNHQQETLFTFNTDIDQYHVGNREVYVICNKHLGKSLFTNMLIEKKLKIPATTRNWNTMNKLLNY